MFWTDDHYQIVSCNQKIDGAVVYALDTLKKNSSKRLQGLIRSLTILCGMFDILKLMAQWSFIRVMDFIQFIRKEN